MTSLNSGANVGSNPRPFGSAPSRCAVFAPAGGTGPVTAHLVATSRQVAQRGGIEPRWSVVSPVWLRMQLSTLVQMGSNLLPTSFGLGSKREAT